MLYTTPEDFFRQAKALSRLTREEEKACARDMAMGDTTARQRLIQSYLPLVAAQIRRTHPRNRTLYTVYCAIAALEKGVDTFDFQQDSETFSHHLSWRLRQCLTRCLVAYF